MEGITGFERANQLSPLRVLVADHRGPPLVRLGPSSGSPVSWPAIADLVLSSSGSDPTRPPTWDKEVL
jgi:hypothetical protein